MIMFITITCPFCYNTQKIDTEIYKKLPKIYLQPSNNQPAKAIECKKCKRKSYNPTTDNDINNGNFNQAAA